MATTNWNAIETEYITGELSTRDLAEKHEVSSGAVGERASLGQWLSKREQFRAQMAEKAKEMAIDAQINVRREILESFVEARRAWSQSKRKAADYGALARLAAAMVGEVTDRQADVSESTLTDAELELIAIGSGLDAAGKAASAPTPD